MDSKSANNKIHAQKESFLWTCEYFSLDPIIVEETFISKPTNEWATIFGGGQKGGRAASNLATRLARLRCAEGNHTEETRLALAAAQEIVTDEPPSYRDAWIIALSGIDHQLSQASNTNRIELAKRLHQLSHAAINDLNTRLDPFPQTNVLDPIISFLLKAENILDMPLSELSVDLERRIRNKGIRKRQGKQKTFFDKHRKGIIKLWHEHREAWFRKRYELKTGKSSPEEFMIKNHLTPSGWQMKEDLRCLFDPTDYEDFHRDMEALYRENEGLPAKGEGWISQTYLAKCVQEVLPDYEILREAKPSWLGRQRLDIFIPTLNLAIEYQGEQHYFPLEHWGGEQGFKDRQVMDQTKRLACQNANIRLIEWNYKTPISIESVRSVLALIPIPKIK